jgi:hypothetical protein
LQQPGNSFPGDGFQEAMNSPVSGSSRSNWNFPVLAIQSCPPSGEKLNGNSRLGMAKRSSPRLSQMTRPVSASMQKTLFLRPPSVK